MSLSASRPTVSRNGSGPAGSSTGTLRLDVTLDDRYAAESGPILLSGIQALVRLTLDQRRLDERRGHDTGVFVSGYQGSPLGGLDQELRRSERWLDPAGVVFTPGINEELAATAVGGTQLLGELAGRRKQGVTGFWFGKNPGLDRAADAIRHATLSGTAPLGGAVALIGDDPSAKSSTVPSSCEPICRSLVLPLLAPGSVAEILVFGLHAVALSRHAGLWTGMKLVADIADSSATVIAGEALEQIPSLATRAAHAPPVLLPPHNLDAEHDLTTARLARVHEYARLTSLNRIVFEPARPRIGVVAAGMGHQALVRALDDLGIDADAREAIGLRIIQLGMPWPLESSTVRELTEGLETVLVIEDKLPFVEAQLKEALYRAPHQPLIVGKEDGAGRPLLTTRSALTADDVAGALIRVLSGLPLPERVRAAVDERARALDRPLIAGLPETPQRTPYFCSGCPHNISTRASADQLVGVGIGCHTMVALDGADRRGQQLGITQMGGEGAQWMGLAPFCSEPHFIQNIGDGTFHHSGSLAIRAAVAAGVNITYRLLYNDAVAMTGGQTPVGKLAVPALISELALEGVQQVVVTTPEPERYHGVTLDRVARVVHRDELDAAQRELATVPGVTVLLHDDRCATEKRRLRKRGKLETPPERVWINERVCEGCGDCGDQSTCLSVVPMETEFGRKTQIHQSSCNQDLSCLKGDCPSFLVVKQVGSPPAKPQAPAPPESLPDPVSRFDGEVLVRMPGVGGTGVVTVSAILQMAAHLQGLHAAGLEQIGLAQKGGPVLSDLHISPTPIDGQLRASRRGVDVLLGFDLLGASTPETLATLDPERTVAVLNSDVTPTASMVTSVGAPRARAERLVERVRRATRGGDAVVVEAETVSARLFHDHMPVNMILVGAALQHGCLPLDPAAVERAIELNGAAVDVNLAAFRWGRAAVAAPEALQAAMAAASPQAPPREVGAAARALMAELDAPAELMDVLELRVDELIAYQDERYARTYAEDVLRVAAVERERVGDGSPRIADAYARGLFKLMAYKDEYEVARLHLDAIERARLADEFGPDVKVQTLLHPPLLRAMGMKRKLRLGRSAAPLFHGLRAARRLRGTPLDPFGHAGVRRTERALVGEYRALVARAVERLDADSVGLVAEIAELPDLVRGYEQIKLDNIERMRRRAGELSARLESSDGRGGQLAVTHAAAGPA
jgi:indolepyruvate ferredoxin oxidoreductase